MQDDTISGDIQNPSLPIGSTVSYTVDLMKGSEKVATRTDTATVVSSGNAVTFSKFKQSGGVITVPCGAPPGTDYKVQVSVTGKDVCGQDFPTAVFDSAPTEVIPGSKLQVITTLLAIDTQGDLSGASCINITARTNKRGTNVNTAPGTCEAHEPVCSLS